MVRVPEEQQILDAAKHMRNVVESASWQYLVKFLQAKQTDHHRKLLVRAEKPEDFYEFEWIKGAISGIQYAIQAPETIMAEAKKILAAEGHNVEED